MRAFADALPWVVEEDEMRNEVSKRQCAALKMKMARYGRKKERVRENIFGLAVSQVMRGGGSGPCYYCDAVTALATISAVGQPTPHFTRWSECLKVGENTRDFPKTLAWYYLSSPA
jgi:hypothetical protein